jgi:hypothetical protein
MEDNKAHIDTPPAAGHIEDPEGTAALDAAAAHPADHDRDMREWAELEKKRRVVKDQLDGLKPRMEQLQERILDDLAARGVKSVHLVGIGKVSTRRDLWAKVKREGEDATDAEKRAAIEALEAAGLGDYVEPKYDSRTISRLFREWEKEGIDPPEELTGSWEAEPSYKLTLTVEK